MQVKEIARMVQGEVLGDGELLIQGVNSLDEAGPGDLSFFGSARYRKSLQKTRASAVLVSEPTSLYKGVQIVVPHPALAYAKIAARFSPPVPRYPGVSPEAWVHPSCRLGRDVSIYPLVYVGMDVEIGDEAVLFPGVYLGEGVRIGTGSVLYPNVTVMHGCRVGNRVVLHAGTVIGSDGFGFVREGAASVKIPQTGTVQIDDDVELGANNTVDRAAFGRTWIQRGVKTDNMVHIGHNVVVGEDTVVVAQTAVAGSVRIGRGVIIGGQVAISDHLEVGDGAMIGSKAGVIKNIPPGGVVSGAPALPHRQWLRVTGITKRLPELQDRLASLERRMQRMEKLKGGGSP